MKKNMCENCKEGVCKDKCCKSKSSCHMSKIAKILVIVGGINWGLVGIGMVFGNINLNIVDLIFGSAPTLEAIIYILVGISSITLFCCCKCNKCKNVCGIEEKKEEVKI